jgi:hypothetical protein
MHATICTGGSIIRRRTSMTLRNRLIIAVGYIVTPVESKVSIKHLTSVKEQIDTNTNSKIKDLLNVYKNGAKDQEKRLKDTIDALRSRLEGLDKSLVGRLSELEILFNSRAATKYVDDSLKELEDRMKRTVILILKLDGFQP